MGVLDNVKAGSEMVADSGIIKKAFLTSFRAFIAHPFISLGVILLILTIFVVLFKQLNDNVETGAQRMTFKLFVSGVTIIIVFGVLLAVDMGMISLQLLSGWF